jgi:hypothetical protein
MGKIDVTFRKPVSWLNPTQLIRTGIKAAEAGLFGSFADRREVIAALSPDADKVKKPAYSYADMDEVWFDYVCDTGDGWNATYAIACLAGREKLDVMAAQGGEKPPPLPRAAFTILGGDEVYPTASLEDYQTRLIDPFYCANTAKPHPNNDQPTNNQPTVYALPGNHDWYDGLTSFMRLFLNKGRVVGPWISGQERTYFAIELPYKWWIWGVDVQLESDVDAPQVAYFTQYAEMLDADHKVILCTPEPSWVEGADNRLGGSVKTRNKTHDNLLHLEKLIEKKNAKIPLRIAGDLHHYARYQSGDSHLVTCGGGGAFLHSTHPLHDNIALGGTFESSYTRQITFSTAEQCKARRCGVFGIIGKNPMFAVTVGLIYAIYAWILGSASQLYLSPDDHQYLFEYFYAGQLGLVCEWWNVVRYSFLGALLTLAIPIGAGFYGASFRRTAYLSEKDKPIRTGFVSFVGGFIHGALHLVAAVLLMKLASCIRFTPETAAFFVTLFAIASLGGFVGSMLMAIYLLLANLAYGGHDEEVFSSQAIEDYKCFARFQVTKDGVKVYPIGLEAVPKDWKPVASATDVKKTGFFTTRYLFDLPDAEPTVFVPADGDFPQPRLIEPAFKIG